MNLFEIIKNKTNTTPTSNVGVVLYNELANESCGAFAIKNKEKKGKKIMHEYEYEKKMLLEKDEFELIDRFLASAGGEISEHINYYFDTPEDKFRTSNTTCRVRQCEDELCGTLKHHTCLDGDCISDEDSFDVDELKSNFDIGHDRVSMKGQMYTRRREIKITPDITLMLDRNIYLGTIDYELEIEYELSSESEVEGIVAFIEKALKRKNVGLPESKSERFFKQLYKVSSYEEVL